MENLRRKREQKITKEQKEVYVEFLEENKDMRFKKNTDDAVQTLWDDLTNMLNSTIGPTKSKEEWKKVFDNWRYVTLKKIRTIKSDIGRTGGGVAQNINITELENRASSCWGKIAIEGHPEVGVAGCSGFSTNENNPVVLEADLGDVLQIRESAELVDQTPKKGQKSNRRKKLRTPNEKSDETFNKLLKEVEQDKLDVMKKIEESTSKIARELERTANVQQAMAESQQNMAHALNRLADGVIILADKLANK